MLYFGMRKNLADICDKWIVDNKAQECTFNVISFLSSKGLLDEDKCVEFVSREFNMNRVKEYCKLSEDYDNFSERNWD